jgi:hypothetical protein
MKNAGNVSKNLSLRDRTLFRHASSSRNSLNYLQIDNQIRKISQAEGVVVLPSTKAWQDLLWTRPHFEKKPVEGYFVWVKKQVDFPLSTCVTLAGKKVSQNMNNLLVVEKGIKAKAFVTCNAKQMNLYGTHRAKGKMVLKEGVVLEYNHVHKWGENDFVSPDYEFLLGKDSKLIYNYQNLLPPKTMEFKTKMTQEENSSSNINVVINSENSKVRINEAVLLNGRGAQSVLRLRLVGKQNADIRSESRMEANAPSMGHLDCQGLLVDKTAKITLIPGLVCKNKESQITHEASIGKISEDELTYLRMRGLSEGQAIDLIINGFLKS